jgi:phosphonate transport system substrate-binding protein
MRISFDRLLLAGLLPALLLAGCARRDEASVGTPKNPLVIVLSPAYVPAAGDALEALRNGLEKASGLTVELKAAQSKSAAIKAFDGDSADAALLSLEEFLVAREEYWVRAELQALRGKGLADYEGVLLTRKNGGAAGVADLAGKKVGFVGPYSVSGFTLPALFLEKAGVKPEPVFAASHEEVLKRLLSGELYAAATYARQAEKAPGLRILAVTGKVPNEPLVFRRGLYDDKREALKKAFLGLAATAEGRKALGALADITGFRPADQNAYKPLHDLLLSGGKPVYDLVPGGWAIYRLNQPYRDER